METQGSPGTITIVIDTTRLTRSGTRMFSIQTYPRSTPPLLSNPPGLKSGDPLHDSTVVTIRPDSLGVREPISRVCGSPPQFSQSKQKSGDYHGRLWLKRSVPTPLGVRFCLTNPPPPSPTWYPNDDLSGPNGSYFHRIISYDGSHMKWTRSRVRRRRRTSPSTTSVPLNRNPTYFYVPPKWRHLFPKKRSPNVKLELPLSASTTTDSHPL